MAPSAQTTQASQDSPFLAAAQSGEWSRLFTPDGGPDLSSEPLFRGGHSDKIALLAEDPALLASAIQAALHIGAWDFINDILRTEHAAACPPGLLRASTLFKNPLSVKGEDLTPQEAAKLSIWRSILVSNPWHATSLSEGDYQDWKDLSKIIIKSLAFSAVPANEFCCPGHLVHVVDAVNAAIRAGIPSNGSSVRALNAPEHGAPPSRDPVHETRPDLATAAASLMETFARSAPPVSLVTTPLSDLNLAALAAHPELKELFLRGVSSALTPVAAKSFLHALATTKDAPLDLTLRVSALATLLSISDLPVSTLVSVLKDTPHGEVRSIAMKALTQELGFPLSLKTRIALQKVGPQGGEVISGLLRGLDRSHSRMEEVSAFPALARSWILACSGASVDHGINTAVINSCSDLQGGPLRSALADFALEPRDPISPLGVAAIVRRWIRA
jgi:hypothetical protein